MIARVPRRSELGRALTEARTRTGKSLRDMAGLVGVSYNTLGSYERGDTLPGPEFLVQFAALAGVPAARLIDLRVAAAEQAAPGLRDVINEHLNRAAAPPAPPGLDEDLLREIITDVEQELAASGLVLAPRTKAFVVAQYYAEVSQRAPDTPRVDRAALRLMLRVVDR